MTLKTMIAGSLLPSSVIRLEALREGTSSRSGVKYSIRVSSTRQISQRTFMIGSFPKCIRLLSDSLNLLRLALLCRLESHHQLTRNRGSTITDTDYYPNAKLNKYLPSNV